MTIREFLNTYGSTNIITNEQAMEGLHYVRSLMNWLETPGRTMMGLLMAKASKELDCLNELDLEWSILTLSAFCAAIALEGSCGRKININEEIPRDCCISTINAHIEKTGNSVDERMN